MREKHFMIDIEATGVDKDKDQILEVGIVEIQQVELSHGRFWVPTDRQYHKILHYAGQPETPFAKQHMKELYKQCNEAPVSSNYSQMADELQLFIHPELDDLDKYATPKLFMGWNASNFDLEFMFRKKVLTPSYYATVDGKEEIRGDVHYRVYEQTGSLQLICDITGLSRKTVEALALELNPTELKLPKGKEHTAIYDCYRQIILQNGLIALGMSGFRK